MKRLFALALVFGWLAVPAARAEDAPSPELMRAAQELGALISDESMQQIVDTQFKAMWPNIEAMLAGKADAATIAELRIDVERTAKLVAAESMRNTPLAYARVYTLQEIRDILAFYKTPTGAKSLRLMPKLVAELTTLSSPRTQSLQRELLIHMQETLQKRGHDNGR